MARMIPAQIGTNYKSSGEKDLFNRLAVDDGAKDWIVLHSLDVVAHQTKITGELDFVVLMPNYGILCLEVKGCSKLVYKDGVWFYGTDYSPDRRGPFKQATEGMHSLRQYIQERDPSLVKAIFWHGVVFPYIDFKIESPEWHPWQVIDQQLFRTQKISKSLINMMDKAINLFYQKGIKYDPQKFTPSIAQKTLQHIRPNFEYFESPAAVKEKSRMEMRNYTDEQFSILDAMAANKQLLFTGPAGTGKTLLAIEAARRSCLAGNKVLLLCFNKNLGVWLKKQFVGSEMNVKVSTLHSHMVSLCSQAELDLVDMNGAEFWCRLLPAMAEDHIDSKAQYDEIIVDEFQDLTNDAYIAFLDKSLKYGLKGSGWKLFGDFEKQMIYNNSVNLESLVEDKLNRVPVYSLRVNCRNTPRIASMSRYLGGLDPDYRRVLRADDRIEPQLIYYTNATDQLGKLESLIAKYLKDGFKEEDIILLSAKNDLDCCAHSLAQNEKWQKILKPYGEAQCGFIKYTTIHAFKGLEESVVILTDLEQFETEATASLCYVGMSRALNRLSILISEKEQTAIIQRIVGNK